MSDLASDAQCTLDAEKYGQKQNSRDHIEVIIFGSHYKPKESYLQTVQEPSASYTINYQTTLHHEKKRSNDRSIIKISDRNGRKT